MADPDPSGAHSFELLYPEPDVEIAPCFCKKMANNGINIFNIVFISDRYFFLVRRTSTCQRNPKLEFTYFMKSPGF